MNKKEHINQILDLVDRSRIPVKRTVDFSLLRTLLNEAIPEQLILSNVSKSFALGKEAIIIECFKGHKFEDGEVVEIVEKFDNELWIVKSKATGEEWYITEEEANVC